MLPSAAQEAALVVHALREAHHERGVPWQEMAVVAPTGARVAALRRALVAGQVPVQVLGSDVPLREEPAVRPLLAADQPPAPVALRHALATIDRHVQAYINDAGLLAAA